MAKSADSTSKSRTRSTIQSKTAQSPVAQDSAQNSQKDTPPGKTRRKAEAGTDVAAFTWPPETELVGLEFDLAAPTDYALYTQYTIGLHAWFLEQVRAIDPELSAYMHDGESEKPFNISALDGQLLPSGRQLKLQPNQIYHWRVAALSKTVVEWLTRWLPDRPAIVDLRGAPLQIRQVRIALPPTTYRQLLQPSVEPGRPVELSFVSPTSFRRKGHHLPLPWPANVFHSYLRRWNDFSGMSVDQEAFLNWIDEGVIIHQVQLQSSKVAAGKRGSVTGFTGTVEYGLTKAAQAHAEFTQLFYALAQLASYCGTGHKTTFGLGQTRSGWVMPPAVAAMGAASLVAQRIAELTDLFLNQRKRQGGDRATQTAETWATILARRELGESLQTIAVDLGMPYETVKSYAKLARRSLRAD